MFISWKTNGTDGAVDTVQNWLVGYNDADYDTLATSNGRVNFKYEMVGADLVITEEWSITKEQYDALNITPCDQAQYDGSTLPIVVTEDHLSF